jgi:hypothetical protein
MLLHKQQCQIIMLKSQLTASDIVNESAYAAVL